jgi:hypothetical protein
MHIDATPQRVSIDFIDHKEKVRRARRRPASFLIHACRAHGMEVYGEGYAYGRVGVTVSL